MAGARRPPARRLAPAAAAGLALAACAALRGRCWAAPGGAHGAALRSRRGALLGGAAAAAAGGLAPAASLALTEEELATVELFRRTSPSVLLVSDAGDARAAERAERGGRAVGTVGSGFAWDRNHVVTTATMMKGIARPQITVLERDAATGEDRRSVLRGALVGVDSVTDVAVLWVDGDMRPLRRGSAEELRVGQDVYALGNPFGFEHSLSKGVVAGLSRTLVSASGRPVGGVIQTDASINPGNSGGPLLDSAGKVIGVNNAILSSSGTFAGVGLAVPIEAVERSVTSVISQGNVQGPSMGVVLAHDAMTQTLGLDGVMVQKVDRGSPAEAAGLRPLREGHLGDVIVGIDERRVDSIQSFFQALDGKLPGEEVLVSVKRPGDDVGSDEWTVVDIKLELGARIL